MSEDLVHDGTDGEPFGRTVSNTIAIGKYAAASLQHGSYNVFLGDGAGEDLTEASFMFILKTSMGVVTKRITREQWEALNEIITGAVLTFKDKEHD